MNESLIDKVVYRTLEQPRLHRPGLLPSYIIFYTSHSLQSTMILYTLHYTRTVCSTDTVWPIPSKSKGRGTHVPNKISLVSTKYWSFNAKLPIKLHFYLIFMFLVEKTHTQYMFYDIFSQFCFHHVFVPVNQIAFRKSGVAGAVLQVTKGKQ